MAGPGICLSQNIDTLYALVFLFITRVLD